jgi:primase-polymerase (primpol)-like protein
VRPVFLRPDFDRIPEALKAERRWMAWRTFERDGRWQKVPALGAKANDPSTWRTFDAACRELDSRSLEGVGFALGDGWGGVDFDKCDAEKPALGRARATGAWLERSPSGAGWKLIGRCARRGGEVNFETCSLVTWKSARFFAVTGLGDGDPHADITALVEELFPAAVEREPVPAFVKPLAEPHSFEPVYARLTDEELVRAVLASAQREKFLALWTGDLSAYAGNHSSADQALVNILAYWAQGDREQVDRLFRESGLYRPKWDYAPYRNATLRKAAGR